MDKEETRDKNKNDENSHEKNDFPMEHLKIEIKLEDKEINLNPIKIDKILETPCFICEIEENNSKNCRNCDKAVCSGCILDSANLLCKNCVEEKIKCDV